MPIISEIQLSALRVLRRLKEAPLGSIVQFQTDEAMPLVGIRAAYKDERETVQAVVVVEGALAGKLIVVDNGDRTPGLDITDVANVVIEGCLPKRDEGSGAIGGNVFSVREGEGTFVGLAVMWSSGGRLAGYLRLSSHKKGEICVPSHTQTLANAIDPILLGRLIVQRRQPLLGSPPPAP